MAESYKIPALNGLAHVAAERGDHGRAIDLFHRALEVAERTRPRSASTSAILEYLGETARAKGDLEAAHGYASRNLDLVLEIAPGSLTEAEALTGLALVSEDRGDLDTAEESHSQALAIRSRLAPGSLPEAQSLHHLGSLHRQRDQLVDAASLYARAVASLESQVGKLGGSREVASAFRAGQLSLYHDYIAVLLDLDRPAEAFHVLERSRAQMLLSMLAERDLVFAHDIPLDLQRQRRRVAAEYDQVQARLAALSVRSDADELAILLSRLRELTLRRQEIAAQVHLASPRLAALQYPQPLAAEGAAATLEPGTVLLSYSVGAEESDVFVLEPSGELHAERLSVGREELQEAVDRWRRLIVRERLGFGDEAAAVRRGRTLFDTLIAPIEKRIARNRRVVIVPDGPLHLLPWAALARDNAGTTRDWQYLVEWKPLHVVLSATLLHELQRDRAGAPADVTAAAPTLLAFGDPSDSTAEAARDSALTPPLVRRGRAFDPLPSTRQELAALEALLGTRATVCRGQEATETRVKRTAHGPSLLHFATHGYVDDDLPLDSGLVLARRPADAGSEVPDNGLLQAWEIFESVRLSADLVTLSACQSGLGKEVRGEGLIGLTRAFQYAGGRTVLASLWSVSDQSTALLMERFYTYLTQGMGMAEALRHAQLDLVEGASDPGESHEADFAHPFHWAGFQLFGAG
jgi:CHAT domain-containing protein/Flp pilus assembly protein TadD